MARLEQAPEATLSSWGDKADARLAWLHDYVAADRPVDEHARELTGAAERHLAVLHRAFTQREGTDWPARLATDLRYVERRKDSGSFDGAIEHLEHLLASAALTGDREARIDVLLQLAECQRRAYRWHAAATALVQVEHLVADDDLPRRVAWTVQRAALLLARGLPDLAVADVEAAERLAQDPWQSTQAMFVRLRLEHALRRPERAVAMMHRFLTEPRPLDRSADEQWQLRLLQLKVRAALAVLVDPREVIADTAVAEAWLDEAIADARSSADERLLARIVRITHRLDHGRWHHVDSEFEAAEAELPAGSAAELDERRLALATLALRHARLANQSASVRLAAADRLRNLWHELVNRWEQLPASRIGEGPLFFGDLRRAFVELLRSHLDHSKDAALGAITEIVRATSPGSLARQLGAPTPSLDEVRRHLCPPGTGILAYVPGHDSSLVAVLDDNSATVHVLPVGAFGIDDVRRELLLALDDAKLGRDAAPFLDACRRCRDMLLPEVVALRLTHWRAVTIVGQESLGYLPFELLPLPSGTRLGASHAVNYLPSLAVGVWLTQHRQASQIEGRQPRVRIVASPDAVAPATKGDRPAPLPFTDGDAAALRRACRSAEVVVRRGPNATMAAAFHDGDEIDLLHVLAHGVRDESRDDPQGILFGDGTLAFGDDIERGHCPAHVLLNVCRAGRGRLRRGDDGRHLLSGATLLAGAVGVVLPVVEVTYRPTLAFAADVHDALWQRGVGLAEALRMARCAAELRRDGSHYDAYCHHLVGIGALPLIARAPDDASRSDATMLVLLGAAVAVVALLCFCARRRRSRSAR